MRLAGTKLAANHQYRGFGDQLYDLSGQRPSLDLNFANSKSLVDATTGQNLVTFTRASSGTYVDSQGVIKTATTNLLLRSEEFGDAVWLKTAVSVNADVEVAPNGALTADKLVEDTATSAHQLAVNLSFNYVSGTTYTLSCYIKAAGRSRFQLAWRSDWFPPDSGAVADLSTGTISVGTNATGTIEAVGNGWYRISVTSTADATGSSPSDLFLSLVNDAGSSNYTGDGTSGIYVWGAQLEQSSTVGEYIPTTSTINSAPRFDHNPTTGESLGLLVEESRTNLSQQSDNFSDVYWVKTDCTITSNESTAPDGTLTADLWTNTASPGTIQNSITKDTAIRTYTASLWVKGTMSQFTVTLDAGATSNRGRVQYNLSTNAVGSVFNEGTFTNTSGTLTPYLNGWVRLTLTTTTSTGTTIRLRPFFSGTGSTVRIWGAQVEEGSFPTSYIPTTTTTVTRSADVASITGSNFSSWYRQDEGTIYSEHMWMTTSDFGTVWGLDDGTGNNETRLIGWNSGTDRAPIMSTNGVAQINYANVSYAAGLAYRYGIALKQDDVTVSRNGATPLTDNIVTLPLVTGFRVGNSRGTAFELNGTIKRLTYFPTRLANETLQRITQ